MMSKTISSFGTLVALSAGLLLGGCNMDSLRGGKDQNRDADATGASEFSLIGSLCGTYAYFNGYADKGGKGTRPIGMRVSLGVCGKRDGVDWKALAASYDDEEVTVRIGDQDGKSPVLVDAKGEVFVRKPDGREVLIGKATDTYVGAPIKFVSGASVQILVDGEPFRLEQHSKSSIGMSLLISIGSD